MVDLSSSHSLRHHKKKVSHHFSPQCIPIRTNHIISHEWNPIICWVSPSPWSKPLAEVAVHLCDVFGLRATDGWRGEDMGRQGRSWIVELEVCVCTEMYFLKMLWFLEVFPIQPGTIPNILIWMFLYNRNYSNTKGGSPNRGTPNHAKLTILVLKPMVTWGTPILGKPDKWIVHFLVFIQMSSVVFTACHQTWKDAGKFQSERRFIARKNIWKQ